MSTQIVDEEPISDEDVLLLKDVIGEKLIEVTNEGRELKLIFQKHIITVTKQWSDVYGTNVFWDIETK